MAILSPGLIRPFDPQALEDVGHRRRAAFGGKHREFAAGRQQAEHFLGQIRFHDFFGVAKHPRRRRIGAAQKCADHFEQKCILVEAKLVFDVRNRRAQEAHAVGLAMMGRVGIEPLHDTVMLRQAAEAAVQIGV